MPTGTATPLPNAPPARSPLAPGTITLRGMRIAKFTESQCVEHVVASILAGSGGWIVTPNLDHMRRYCQDPSFRSMVDACDVCVADGMPLIWASRLQRTPLPERVAGSNLITSLSAALGRHGGSVFMLGGDPGTAQAAGEILAARFPGLRIAGALCPPMGFDRDEHQMALIRGALQAARPDLVFVALGSPKQERLTEALRSSLPGAWWIGIGISFSFISGDVKRAPRWMQRVGLEWFHRLTQEPRRLFKRYLIDGVPFAARLLAGAAIDGFRSAPRKGP